MFSISCDPYLNGSVALLCLKFGITKSLLFIITINSWVLLYCGDFYGVKLHDFCKMEILFTFYEGCSVVYIYIAKGAIG